MFKKKYVVLIIGVILVLSLAVLFYSSSKHNDSAGQAKVAVIYVDGVIMGGRSQNLLNEYNGTETVMRQLHDARDDKTIKAIVLRINSPGGSVPATQELGEEIDKLRRSGKPVIASMGDIAASGGYWIAAIADKIYANPSTLTGSIGVYMPYSNWQELYKKIGIHQEKIKSGQHKDILSPERPITAKEREIIQVMVDDMYEQFVSVVSKGRKLTRERVKELADGRIYTGNQALKLGLVDEMGNLYDAIDGAAKMAGITGVPQIKEYGKASPLSMILGASDKFNVKKEVLTYLKENQLFVNIPLALPDKW